jgi:L-asparaginase II
MFIFHGITKHPWYSAGKKEKEKELMRVAQMGRSVRGMAAYFVLSKGRNV